MHIAIMEDASNDSRYRYSAVLSVGGAVSAGVETASASQPSASVLKNCSSTCHVCDIAAVFRIVVWRQECSSSRVMLGTCGKATLQIVV